MLDPFFGTGTTGAVARRLGRRWIGIERERGYVEGGARADRLDAAARRERDARRGRQAQDQPRVAFGLLVETGMVPAGTILTDAKRRWTATVRADGSIACGGHSGSIHKVGAALRARRRATAGPSGTSRGRWLEPLDALRQQHLSAL